LSYSKKLPIGSLGLAQVPIEVDKWGEAFIHYIPYQQDKFPPGTYKIHALEDIRAFRDIIIIEANNGAIEHTPQELKYLNRLDKWQNVDWRCPLPVTMGSRGVPWASPVTATAAGNTPILGTSGVGKVYVIHAFSISNSHAVPVTVGLRFTITGTIMHRYTLAASGGNIAFNLADAPWESGDNEDLYAWLNAVYAAGVIFNVAYTIEDVPT